VSVQPERDLLLYLRCDELSGEMKRLYSLRLQIDKQGNVMVPFLTEDTSRVEFDDLVVGSGETVVHSITPSSRLTLSAYINLEE